MATSRLIWVLLIVAGLLFGPAPAAQAGDEGEKVPCDKILAASEEAGGSKSADELAKQLGTHPRRVRRCMERTQGGKKPVPAPKQPPSGEPKPSPQ